MIAATLTELGNEAIEHHLRQTGVGHLEHGIVRMFAQAWLTDVLSRIADLKVNRIDDLLP